MPTTDLHAAGREPGAEFTLRFAVDHVALTGDLAVPTDPRGLVVFAHGSGSSRRSARNRAVARRLQDAGFATLLFDLLDAREEARRELVFDVALLARRLEAVVHRLRSEPLLEHLPLALFGASTGAAAALWAAADLGDEVGAVISRGGRPDLTSDRLAAVRAPTLLIVGGADTSVLALNRDAAARLRCPAALTIVPGATHLFAEPGALERVADLAAAWCAERLAGEARPAGAPRPPGLPAQA